MNMMETSVKTGVVHIPVLPEETISLLDLKEGDVVVDGTYGGGGHSAMILEKIGSSGRLLAIDWNEHAVRGCAERHGSDPRVTCAAGNYKDIREIMRITAFPSPDAILLDLGLSSDELEHSGRGFSFRENEPLIMTYNDSEEPVSALLRKMSEDDLTTVIRTYGEERFAGRIARAIKEAERRAPVETASELADIISAAVPKKGFQRIHPATRTFMALRIFANSELDNAKIGIKEASQALNPGGRLAVISFHSLEDRIVKYAFRDMAKTRGATILTKKPLVAGEDELARNPRARSAKLRAVKLA